MLMIKEFYLYQKKKTEQSCRSDLRQRQRVSLMKLSKGHNVPLHLKCPIVFIAINMKKVKFACRELCDILAYEKHG